MNEAFNIFARLQKQRIVFLGQAITEEVTSLIISQLLSLEQEDREKDIHLHINSPGGLASGGFAIYETMQAINPDVVTTSHNMAAGMAAFLLATGAKGKRIARSKSKISLGRISSKDTRSIVRYEVSCLNRTMSEILGKHTGQTADKIQLDSAKNLQLSPQIAKEYGFIDLVKT